MLFIWILWILGFLYTWIHWNHLVYMPWIIRIKKNGIFLVFKHMFWVFLLWPLILIYMLFIIDWIGRKNDN